MKENAQVFKAGISLRSSVRFFFSWPQLGLDESFDLYIKEADALASGQKPERKAK